MKFSLTRTTKVEFGITFHQIKAEETKNEVSKGDLGGWIDKKENLDMDGNAWVSGDARVSGNARVYGNAWVSGDARVYGELKISLGYFFGMRFYNEEIKYKKIEDGRELIYKGEAKFDEEDDEIAKVIKFLTEKGKIVDGKILTN